MNNGCLVQRSSAKQLLKKRVGKPTRQVNIPIKKHVGKPKYLEAWFARAWLLASMASQGVTSLSHTGALGWQDFANAFPDSKAWFPKLAAHGSKSSSLRSYFQDVGYSGRPEFFSAMTCLLLGKGMKVNPTWLQVNRHKIQSFRKQYHSHHSLHMVPARVVRALLLGKAVQDP